MKAVDILLPIYNGLTYVRACIDNVIKYTDKKLYTLWLLDDGSDGKTQEYLEQVARCFKHVRLIRNTENLGFVKNCNNGFARTDAEWLLLLNSDVLVTPGWLERLLECGNSADNIAAVNPLTNQASQINVPMAPGCSYLTVNELFSSRPLASGYPDIVTGVGFCMLLRRSSLSEQGLFDEIYGKGYCEESDLCMRLTTSGYRVVVNPQVYVYHKGRGTFTDRAERYKNNRKIFDQRWQAEYAEQFRVFRDQNPIQPLRDLMQPQVSWDPYMGARLAYRNVRNQFLRANYLNTLKAAIRFGYDAFRHRTAVFKPENFERFGSRGTFSVTYVLHNLTVAGGVLSVIQLVNQLIQNGVDARIVALREYPEVYDWQLLTRPIIYQSANELIRNFPKSDLAVATHWTTAEWVNKVVQAGKATKSAYFLQDYEPWFFTDDDLAGQKSVRNTFDLIDNKIVKSDWLSGMMKFDGYTAKKIRLGMNLDVFYPRARLTYSDKVRILAMARPRTPRRGFEDLVSALNLVWEKSGHQIEITFFGEESLPAVGGFIATNLGVISDQNTLAQLYSDHDIFIDSSVFQGFGRTALEAMACGVACVVTNVGGVNEYAVNDVNCVALPPSQPHSLAKAVLELIQAPKQRERLSSAGIETAQLFCHRREGQETFEYFTQIL